MSTLGKHWKVSEKGRRNMVRGNKEKWKNPKYRANVIRGVSRGLQGNTNTLGKHWKVSEIGRKNISKSQIGRKKSEKTKQKIGKTNSVVIKKKWKDPDYARKVLTVNTPNKSEIILDKFLQKICQSKYKFVGNGEFVLDGKCPDFLNIDGKKKLIELYGDYWHGKNRTGKTKKEAENERIFHFEHFGYDTLVIWESELKNLLVLKKRILKFNKA